MSTRSSQSCKVSKSNALMAGASLNAHRELHSCTSHVVPLTEEASVKMSTIYAGKVGLVEVPFDEWAHYNPRNVNLYLLRQNENGVWLYNVQNFVVTSLVEHVIGFLLSANFKDDNGNNKIVRMTDSNYCDVPVHDRGAQDRFFVGSNWTGDGRTGWVDPLTLCELHGAVSRSTLSFKRGGINFTSPYSSHLFDHTVSPHDGAVVYADEFPQALGVIVLPLFNVLTKTSVAMVTAVTKDFRLSHFFEELTKVVNSRLPILEELNGNTISLIVPEVTKERGFLGFDCYPFNHNHSKTKSRLFDAAMGC